MTVDGGLRTRYISDSTRVTIIAALHQLGWFETGRRHQPLNFAPKPEEWQEEIVTNTFSITLEDQHDQESELGGVMIDDFHAVFFDFYAENGSLGRHLAWDVHDIVMGQMPSVGRHSPMIDVFDLQQATPSIIHRLDVERASVMRVDGFPRPWQRFWWSVRFDLLDDHGDSEDEIEDFGDIWDDSFQFAWTTVQAVI